MKRISKATAILNFRNYMTALGFKQIPLEEVTTDIVENGRLKPKRATIANVLQNQYKYKSPTGNCVKILTGTKDGKPNEKGSAWIHITDKNDKKLMSREFYKDDIKSLLRRLFVYSILGKNLADNKPAGMNLVEITETEYAWVSKNGKIVKPIKMKDYIYGLNPEDKKFILTNESQRNSYLRRSKAWIVKRQREIQKKWN